MYEYTYRDGERVEVNVASRFDEMAAAFYAEFGLSLHVNSGTRTREEQERLYHGWINRLPGFYLAAPPGQSFHEESGPQGPRALDLRDSGNDAGVMTIGTVRNNWIRDNGPRWGFTLSGLTFNPREGWHIHNVWAIGSGAVAGGSTGFPANARYGADWVRSAQNKLNRMGINVGDEDGLDGGNTQAGVKVLQGFLGVDQDGIYGPQTNAGADVILAGGNFTARAVSDIQRLVGAGIDNVWGPVTSLHVYVWQKRVGLPADAQWGPASDAVGFPVVVVPPTPAQPGKVYPTTGSNITTRPTVDIQRKLIAGGFLAAGEDDGAYGPNTSVGVGKFQESVGLEVDSIYGNNTDAKLFAGVSLPAAGTATPRTPVYPGATAGWNVPLGQTKRDASAIISKYIIHHETAFESQVKYFQIENSRGSCPTWEVDGKIVTEMIHPALRPSATGSANTYSVASETVNTGGEPDWKVSLDSLESHAQIAAWLSQQTEFVAPDGTVFKVRVKLDRESIIGHNEAGVNATACPGPFQSAHLDWIVARAKEIVAAQSQPPVVVPEPEDMVLVPRSQLEAFFNWLKGLLGK